MPRRRRDDLGMEDWTDKSFRLQKQVYEAFRATLGPKGDQMVAATAALVMYLRASEEERQACRELVDKVRRDLVPAQEAVDAGSAGEHSLAGRVERLEKAIKRIDRQHRREDAAARVERAAQRAQEKRSAPQRHRES